MLTPPSTSFEVNITGWSLVNQNTSALSKGQGNGNACDGSYYLAVDGSVRGNDWNGPLLDLTPYIVQGRTYAVTVAARFEPASAPTTASGLTLVCHRKCSDGTESFSPGATLTSTYEWVRFSESLLASTSGCPALTAMRVYVQTDVAHKSNSLHVDDFRIYDMSVSAAGGSGGGAAGSSSSGAGSSSSGSAGAFGAAIAGTAGTGG